MLNGNLKLAIQKKGRLTDKSLQLLKNCGLEIEDYSERLIISARNYELDILFLRDDDIPEYVQDGVADIGIVGEDIIFEKKAEVEILRKLGFGKCRLALALPESKTLNDIQELNGKKIATSFPNILKNFLQQNKIDAKIIEISGSVEITPSLGVADYICDLVSTGNTLKLNKLKKSFDVFDSQAALIMNKNLPNDSEKYNILLDFLFRIDSALKAKTSKYLMMNAPKDSLEIIKNIVPSLKSPTVVPLADESLVAVHAVIPADEFWNIYKNLKDAGASGILLLPIENMIL
ncbi:MAG: ATP phosphoribosyltransferase [Stygiobacter sp.]|jgi:ATP phosphoribosyltransferase|uniref:ATP phosphoribosyltransferase n=1 Tax=Stygiobacter electus TaxID=3032292 RepID=A0AAE3NY07_9BACT|nr:ATP phosphoribosyltransferase [Stygiobacter electus]MDF1610685.1 ATP phosphoribosyltransferase [Stygiobacter electus]